MSNLTKAESARIDGAKSSDPKTPQGRATTSRNAFSDGPAAKTLILQNENPDRFVEMWNACLYDLQPTNQIEIDLISDRVAAPWRLHRFFGTNPTEPKPAKSPLNGKKQALNGDQKQGDPTHEPISVPEPAAW